MSNNEDYERRVEIQRQRHWPVVCICGSMRFYDWMLKVAERYTLTGHIVLIPLVCKEADMADAEKRYRHEVEQALPSGVNLPIFLDAMHRRKIDMSEQIIVCTDSARYIGDSTSAEILYAVKNGKDVVVEASQ